MTPRARVLPGLTSSPDAKETPFPDVLSQYSEVGETVALEIEIVVNGAARTVAWGGLLESLATHPRKLRLLAS